MLKKLIIVSIIGVCMLSVFTLTPKDTKAATLPQALFTDFGEVYISVADLGAIFGSEWEITAFNVFPVGTDPFGFGFRNYNVTNGTAVQTVFEDDTWFGAAMVYTWVGEGTQSFISITNSFQGVDILTTTPPPAAAALSSSMESMSERTRRR